MATRQEDVLRVYFKDKSYKSFHITAHTTAEELCVKFAQKLQLGTFHFHFALKEINNGSERYLANDELLLNIKAKWKAQGFTYEDDYTWRIMFTFTESSHSKLVVRLTALYNEGQKALKKASSLPSRLESFLGLGLGVGTSLSSNVSKKNPFSFSTPSLAVLTETETDPPSQQYPIADRKATFATGISCIGLGRGRGGGSSSGSDSAQGWCAAKPRGRSNSTQPDMDNELLSIVECALRDMLLTKPSQRTNVDVDIENVLSFIAFQSQR